MAKLIDAENLKLAIIALREEAERCDLPVMVRAMNLVLMLIDATEEVSKDGEK